MNSIEKKKETPKKCPNETQEQRQEGPRHLKGGQKKKKIEALFGRQSE